MKITKYLVLALLAVIVLSSCHDDVETKHTESPSPESKLTEWLKYIGIHFTRETSDQFYWVQHTWCRKDNEVLGYQTFLQYCRIDGATNDVTYLKGSEFVEFVDLTDSQITIRVGNDKLTYYNLSNITDKQINIKVLCPNSLSWINQVIEIPLEFDYKANPSCCFFEGKFIDQIGYKYKSSGYLNYGRAINDQLKISLHIAFSRENPASPFPELKISKYIELGSSGYPEHIFEDLNASTYSFNKSTLQCIQSPVIVQWNSAAWKGDVASLMPSLSDFIQLLIGIPVLDPKEYYYKVIEDSEMPIEKVIRTVFPGVMKKGIEMNYHGMTPGDYIMQDEEYGSMTSAASISKIDDNRMSIVVDARKISLINSNLKNRLFYANILRSLLSEEKCYFEMNYKLYNINSLLQYDNLKRQFHMTLSDPQHSRNIMEYVILPLILENREAIKDYIRQDAELSQHADVLCSAVDRLEEIYDGTTDLTLGYRLIENQWE